jgi:ubiquitin C-terminal hydrolase
MSMKIIEKTFEGTFQKAFKCEHCGSVTDSKKQDKFYILNLPTTPRVFNIDLTQCLDHFTNPSSIEWTCAKCRDDNSPSLLKVIITKLPQILILRVKTSVEQALFVNYELTIDMTKYCNTDLKSASYSLIAVINHAGSHFGGHC